MKADKYQRAVSYLSESSRFRVNPSLDNIIRFLRKTKFYPPSYKVIQVVGTNGKTSTTVILASLFSCLKNLKVGLYLSPHVIHYGERITINGRSLSSKDFGDKLLSFLSEYRALIDECFLTEFEILTAFAHLLFEKEGVDMVVLEAGLGGRFDATTALEPSMGVFTSLSYDHMDVLGKTLRKIASEKISQFKDKTVVLSPSMKGEVNIVKAVARKSGVKTQKSDFIPEDISISESGTEFFIFNQLLKERFPVRISLIGEPYAHNVATALSALYCFFESENWARPEVESFIDVLKSIYIPARFDIKIYKGKKIIIDGAHNPQAVSATISVFKKLYEGIKPAVVFSFLKDKEGEKMVEIVKKLSRNIWLVPIATGGKRALSDDELRNFCQKNLLKYAPSIEAGIEEAVSSADVTLVIGSIYLAGEVLAFLGNCFYSESDSLRYFESLA